MTDRSEPGLHPEVLTGQVPVPVPKRPDSDTGPDPAKCWCPDGRCCPKHKIHTRPHRGCILR